MLVTLCAKYGKNPSKTARAVERAWQGVPYFISFIAQLWLNDIEDIGDCTAQKYEYVSCFIDVYRAETTNQQYRNPTVCKLSHMIHKS